MGNEIKEINVQLGIVGIGQDVPQVEAKVVTSY